jgi:hypothetical protein
MPPHPISPRSNLILATHLLVSFLLAFPLISYMHSSSPPIRATYPVSLILLDLYWAKSTSYEAPHYAFLNYLHINLKYIHVK